MTELVSTECKLSLVSGIVPIDLMHIYAANPGALQVPMREGYIPVHMPGELVSSFPRVIPNLMRVDADGNPGADGECVDMSFPGDAQNPTSTSEPFGFMHNIGYLGDSLLIEKTSLLHHVRLQPSFLGEWHTVLFGVGPPDDIDLMHRGLRLYVNFAKMALGQTVQPLKP